MGKVGPREAVVPIKMGGNLKKSCARKAKTTLLTGVSRQQLLNTTPDVDAISTTGLGNGAGGNKDLTEHMEAQSASAADDTGGAWTHVPTASDKAVQRARKAVNITAFSPARTRDRISSSAFRSRGFEVEFIPANSGTSFKEVSLLKIYESVRARINGAQARVNSRGSLIITVPKQEQLGAARQITEIAGVAVTLCEGTALPLWGRITGVHPQFSEEALLEALHTQGVEKVVRETYTVKEVSETGAASKAVRASRRVRLLFKSKIVPHVTIAYEQFAVTLCSHSPMQCFTCCKFGHRAADCPRQGMPVCRKCGSEGHEMWQCEKEARCVNCRGQHASNDRRCRVYAVYAQAAVERYANKLVASVPNTEISDGVRVESQNSKSAMATKPSFAAVVRGTTPRAIVQKTSSGEHIICNLPRIPAPKASGPLSKKATQDTLKQPATEKAPALLAVSQVCKIIKAIWEILRPSLEPFMKELSLVDKVIETLSQADVLGRISFCATNSAAPHSA